MPELGGNHYFNGLDTFMRESFCSFLNIKLGVDSLWSRDGYNHKSIEDSILKVVQEITKIRTDKNTELDNDAPFFVNNKFVQEYVDLHNKDVDKKGDSNSFRYGKTQIVFEIEIKRLLEKKNLSIIEKEIGILIYYLFNNSVDLVMRKFALSKKSNLHIDAEKKWFQQMLVTCAILKVTPYKTTFDVDDSKKGIEEFDEKYKHIIHPKQTL